MSRKALIRKTLVAILLTILITKAITYEDKADAIEPEVITKQTVKFIEIPRPIYVQQQAQSIVNATDLGNFEITYYTAGPESTGKNPGDQGYGETYSGAIVTKGVTVAVDPKVIPLGSYIYIEGIGFRVAQDVGSAIKGKDIDVYVPGLKEALRGGRHKARVYLIKGGETIENK